MRYYEYSEPSSETDPTPVFVRRSEHEILIEYSGFWIKQMIKAGQNLQDCTLQDIIDDWIVVNWATEVFPK